MLPNFASARQTARSKRRRPMDPATSKTRRSANVNRSAGTPRCLGHRGGEQAARALGGLDRRVAHHQRDAAGIRAEIDRREIGVAGDRAHVERIDAENLGDAGHQHIVRSLADFRRAAEGRDAAAAIELQLHAGVRHVVPVDRQAGAREIGRAGQAEAAAGRQLACAAASPTPRRPAGCTRRARWCRRAR